MLITKPQVHIVTREVTLASGKLVRAYFAVVDINGVLDIKFLGTKPIETTLETQPEVLLLENRKEVSFGETPVLSPYEKVSHYFTLDFLQNQLARAPSL